MTKFTKVLLGGLFVLFGSRVGSSTVAITKPIPIEFDYGGGKE